jgi:ABC-2 type transport system permease protein
MAVYKRTYKAYGGPLTPAWSRFTVLARYGFSTLFTSRWFTAYTVLCFAPFLVGLSFIYLTHNASVQALVNIRFGPNTLINNSFFMTFLAIEGWMGFILTAWAAPGMISKDFANHAVQLYLSRPLSRAEYLLGKVSVIAALLSLTTWIPILFLFLVQAQLEGHGWGWENLWMAAAIVLSGLMGIALVSLVSLAIAVWVRWRIAATALLMAIFFVLPGFGTAMNLVLRTRWGWLLNFGYLTFEIWGDLFRIVDARRNPGPGIYQVPVWSAWITLLAVCAFSLWLLHRRLQAREVERA